jgi:DNA-binding MarR family transcriptional regulator
MSLAHIACSLGKSTMKDRTDSKHSPILDIAQSWRRERPDLGLDDFLLGIYVMRLGRVLDDSYDRMCRKRFGISGADMRVLFALRRAGKPYARRPTDLFRALLVTSGAMTKQVDRLSGLGFVERLDDPGHSRGFLILLTAKGLKAANAATEMLAEHSPIAPGLRSLNSSDRAALRRLIETVLVELESAPLTAPAKADSKGERNRGVSRA